MKSGLGLEVSCEAVKDPMVINPFRWRFEHFSRMCVASSTASLEDSVAFALGDAGVSVILIRGGTPDLASSDDVLIWM